MPQRPHRLHCRLRMVQGNARRATALCRPAGDDMIALALSTLLSLAIPAALIALWIVAACIAGPIIGRALAYNPERRTRRLTDTKPRRLL